MSYLLFHFSKIIQAKEIDDTYFIELIAPIGCAIKMKHLGPKSIPLNHDISMGD